MTLRTAIDQYIDWQRERGAIFSSPANLLRCFSRSVGEAIDSDAVSSGQAAAFIAGDGPPTNYCYMKHRTLAGFYRYALARGLATRSPLPAQLPRRFPPKPPYIYSPDEVRRLLDATSTYRKRVNQLEPHTLRTLVLLLYGTGLRRGEAQRLRLTDVALGEALLTVRRTKFFKSRLVPLAPPLVRALEAYAVRRMAGGASRSEQATFLVNRDGTPLARSTLHEAFAQLRRKAGVGSEDLPCQPRLHDLRHNSESRIIPSRVRSIRIRSFVFNTLQVTGCLVARNNHDALSVWINPSARAARVAGWAQVHWVLSAHGLREVQNADGRGNGDSRRAIPPRR